MNQQQHATHTAADAAADAGQRIAQSAFVVGLASGQLPRSSYRALLEALRIVYASLEQATPRADPTIGGVERASGRVALIDHDLATLADEPPGDSAATLQASLLAQQIRRRAEADPISLTGYTRVFHGPALTAIGTAAQLVGALRVSPDSTRLFSSATPESPVVSHADDETHRRIAAAEREAWDGLALIVEAILPSAAPNAPDRVHLLNPEAGTHAIPGDPREIEAALRAGERTWREFPYYEWRYGERGARFTRSDSAWLVTLSGYDRAAAEQQIAWLGRVLAARGMPQWLLERHLDTLYEELVAAVPDRQPQYATLHHVAALLRHTREQQLAPDLFAALIDDFAQQVGDEWAARLPRTGGLLAAAVADEQAGVTQAVTSIHGWMTDPERFPPAWIAAVERTIARARQHAAARRD